MKKILLICITFIIMAFIVFSASYFDEDQVQYNQYYYSGERIDGEYSRKTFYLLGANKDPASVFNDIEQCLNQFGANLYTFIYSPEDDITTKLIYVSDPDPFAELSISNGRFFTADENRTDLFLSTSSTSDPRQIGVLPRFDKNFIIRTIYGEIENNVFSREFTLLLPEADLFPEFMEMLRSKGYEIRETHTEGTSMESQNSFYLYVKLIAVAAALVIISMTLVFHVVNSYRKIGIEKMLGFGMFAIWKKRIPVILLCELIISAAGLLISYILLFDNWSVLVERFYIVQIETLAAIIALSFLVSFLPFIYVNRIRIADVLKNKRSTSVAIGVNSALKIIISVFLICLLFSVYSQIQQIQARYNYSYEKWEETKNYAVITHTILINGIYDPYAKENIKNFELAYNELNRNGAIFADFDAYAQESDYLSDLEKCAIVNNNYLINNQLTDPDGNIVNPAPSQDYVLLVPEKYKKYESQITQLHKRNADSGQTIKIIWLENDQECFSYRLDIEPENGNKVHDPMLLVVEEKGSVWCSNIASSKLLIQVVDTTDPSEEINQVMEHYFDGGQVRFAAFGVYSLITDKIESAARNIAMLSCLLIAGFVIMAYIIIQNIHNYFDQNRQRIAVQHCMGFNYLDKYKGLAILILTSFFIELICVLLISGSDILLFWAAAVIFEILISYLFIIKNERRSVLKVLKGG